MCILLVFEKLDSFIFYIFEILISICYFIEKKYYKIYILEKNYNLLFKFLVSILWRIFID